MSSLVFFPKHLVKPPSVNVALELDRPVTSDESRVDDLCLGFMPILLNKM